MSYPLAIVDRDGCVWPWDGQEENPALLAAGSRYLHTQKEVATAKASYSAILESQDTKRRGFTTAPDEAPKKRRAVGSAKKVREAVLGSGSSESTYTTE